MGEPPYSGLEIKGMCLVIISSKESQRRDSDDLQSILWGNLSCSLQETKQPSVFVCKFLSVSTWWCNRQCMIMLGNCFHYFFYISKEIPGLLLFRSKQECYLWILIYLPWVLLVQKFWFWLDKSTFPFSYIPCYWTAFLLCSLSNWHKAQH